MLDDYLFLQMQLFQKEVKIPFFLFNENLDARGDPWIEEICQLIPSC
jgi:hypothetical protein